MKQAIKYLMLFTVTSLLLVACEKDLVETVMQPGPLPVVSTSPASIILTEANAADTVETISWTPAEYGFPAAVSYTLQVAKGGTDFATPKDINMGNNTSLKYTGADLNQLALLAGLPPGSEGQLDLRVKSSLSDSLVTFSENTTLTVTPYRVIINYPSLWVPGDYQGWDPATAPKISSKPANGIYEGYVDIPAGGTLQFKLTSDPDWNHTAYGWASSTVSGDNVSGTFNTTGGNLFVPSGGYYLLKANTMENTWSATRINSLSLIGDFNNWAGDAPMTYDPVTKQWTGTFTAPEAGGFKIRANNDWPINFGDTGGDLGLDYDGENIPITAGQHQVIVDLSVPGNYSYKIL